MMRRRPTPSAAGLPLHGNSDMQDCSSFYYSNENINGKEKQRSPTSSSCLRVVNVMVWIGLVVGIYEWFFPFFFRNFTTTSSTTPEKETLWPPSKYGPDLSEECQEWAKQGDCTNQKRVKMLTICPTSCDRIANINVDVLTEEQHLQDAQLGYAHFFHPGDVLAAAAQGEDDDDEEKEEEDYSSYFVKCQDDPNVDCQALANDGDCMEDSPYMVEHCPQTCLACFGSESKTVTINFGVAQVMDDSPESWDVLGKTREYMIQIYTSPKEKGYRRDCRNLDPYCSQYAAAGECHGQKDAIDMFLTCAPACHACHAVEYQHRCQRDPDRDVDILENFTPLFEGILEQYPQYKPQALARPPKHSSSSPSSSSSDEQEIPWIVQLDDFLSPEECQWLIETGKKIGFNRTTVTTDEVTEDGHFADVNDGEREAYDAWCSWQCDDDPYGRVLIDRMTNLTNIPREYTEPLELIKYDTGGFYIEHHDVIETHGFERCGNRFITLFLFLNDVEEGGNLVFGELFVDSAKLTIAPKQGRALLFQNVLSDDFTKRNMLAVHEGTKVTKGIKYAANFWFHPHNVEEASEAGCCE